MKEISHTNHTNISIILFYLLKIVQLLDQLQNWKLENKKENFRFLCDKEINLFLAFLEYCCRGRIR